MAETMLERVANAIMRSDVCGYTNDSGEHVLCLEESLPSDLRQPSCSCLNSARAAIEAYEADRFKAEDNENGLASLLYEQHRKAGAEALFCPECGYVEPDVASLRAALSQQGEGK